MDLQLAPHLSQKVLSHEGPDSFGIDDKNKDSTYKKCRYIGTAGIDGSNYHQYICPNMYNDSVDAFLEIDIPFADEDGHSAIIRSADRASLQKKLLQQSRPAYIEFDGQSMLNPKHLRTVDRSLPPEPFPEAYPSLISFRLSLGSVRSGQKKKPVKAYSKEELEQFGKPMGHHYLLCPETSPYDNMKDFIYSEQELRSDCEVWYWTNFTKIIGNIETGVDKKNIVMKRYAGYLWTVPVDIITSPFQLIGLLIFSAGWKKAP